MYELHLSEGHSAVSTADLIQSEYDQKPSSWDMLYNTLQNFLCTALAIHMRHGHEPSKTNMLRAVPGYRHVLSFPVSFSLWGIKNFHVAFPKSIKFQLLSKMPKMPLPK